MESSAATPIATGYASVSWGGSSERRENARQIAVQSATFRCLTTTALRAVRAGDRLISSGNEYGIVGIVHLDKAPGESEITVTAELDQ